MHNVIFLAVLLLCKTANAGYAEVAPPSNWTTTPGATGFYRAASNDVSFTNGVRGSAGVLNVGGQAVKMPAAYRFAPNAARFAAGVAFGNPAVFLAMGAAGLAYKWYLDSDFEVRDGIWQKKTTSGGCVSSCYEYLYFDYRSIPLYHATPELACSAAFSNKDIQDTTNRVYMSFRLSNTNCFVKYRDANWSEAQAQEFTYVSQYRSVPPTAPGISYAPVTVQDFQDQMATKPIPHGVPQVFPSQLPVELPIINPTPQRVPYAPSDPSPTQQPTRVPQGEPQAIPDTSPQKWRQPAIDIIPSPRLDQPWRVDVQPRDIIRDTPDPLPDSSPVPATPPPGTTSAPATPDLCAANPDILACQKVKLGDTPDPVKVENENKPLAINKDGGWGPSGGSCPAPRTVSVHGIALAMPFDLLCQFANGIRPIVIGLAWLGAALTFFGFSRKN